LTPPREVIAAFGADDVAMFKPLDMDGAALEWQAEVLASLEPDGFRVAAPLRARDGSLVVGGWTAWPRLEGRHEPRWAEIVAVGERFHRALAGFPRPAVLDARTDPWAHADRIAWDEGDVHDDPDIARLLAARRPVDAPEQLIHGDLSGNVLFADSLPPAVIDFSPYWRPAGYASAIVVADAVAWYGARPSLLATVDRQLLIRAVLFRLLCAADLEAARREFRPALQALAA
jgi:uncharacterized protein (TIGR02569 family)